MAAPFTLTIGGEEKSLAEWKLARPRIRLNALAQSFLTIDAPGADVHDDPLMAFEAEVILKKDGVQIFRGPRVDFGAHGNGRSEGQYYSFADPWYWLDNIIFEQEWSAGSNSHVILCMNAAGALIKTGAQITAALQFAIAKGAPITIGTIEEGVLTYFNEQQDQPVSKVIRDCAHYSQPCVAFFDYTTENPTFHLVRHANAVSVSLPFVQLATAVGGVRRLMSDIDIKPLPALVRPSVNLRFEITTEANGVPVVGIAEQNAPDPSTPALRSMVSTISLQGPSVSIASARIVTEDCRPDLQAWWEARREETLDAAVTLESVIDLATGAEVDVPPYELISGQIADWFPEDIYASRVRFVGRMSKTVGETTYTKKVHYDAIVTNAESGVYRDRTVTDSGETLPVGLADYLLANCSVLQYQGRYTLTESECHDYLFANDAITLKTWLGKKLNISGGRADWETMNALIQQVDCDMESGRTSLTFGPAEHLGLGDIMDLLKHLQRRVRRTSARAVLDGTIGSGDVQMGQHTPNSGSSGGHTEYSQLEVGGENGVLLTSEGMTVGGELIRLLRGDLAQLNGNAFIKFRIVPYSEQQPDGTCRTRKIIIPCSEVFD